MELKMKQISIIVLILVCVIFKSNAAERADSLLVPATPAGTLAYMPSSLAELESFLRRNAADIFPEESFMQFSAPFQSNFARQRRIDQLRMKTAALGAVPKMVALAYYAFTQEIERRKTVVSVGAITDIAASRIDTLRHYRECNHLYFLRFQNMLMELFRYKQDSDSEVTAALTQPFGISPTFEMAWLRDNNGIVPVPLSGPLKRVIYSASTPYGDWGDNYQRALTFIDGHLILAPGIHIYTRDSNVFKFVQENGINADFMTSPITARTSGTNLIIRFLLERGVFRESGDPGHYNTFITLPVNPIEEKEFEAAFLEEMIAEAERRDSFAEAFLIHYSGTLTQDIISGATTAAAASEATLEGVSESASSFLTVRAYIDSLYEEQIRAEQEEISRQVREHAVAGRVKKNKKKAVVPAQVEEPSSTSDDRRSSAEYAALKMSILSKLKERGREKWGTLIRVLTVALKDARASNKISMNVGRKGSHFTIHMISDSGSDGLTIVRPHGKIDRTLPAAQARGLAGQLIDLSLRLMRE
jgi:hypothetical protein